MKINYTIYRKQQGRLGWIRDRWTELFGRKYRTDTTEPERETIRAEMEKLDTERTMIFLTKIIEAE